MFKIFNSALSAVALLLSTPSILILISWNTLPGDALYPFKRGLETVVLAATGGTPVERRLKVEFVARRFIESDRLLTEKRSIEGFEVAVKETKEATKKIIAAQDTGAKEKLVENITQYQEKLEERKRQIVTRQIIIEEQPKKAPDAYTPKPGSTTTPKTPQSPRLSPSNSSPTTSPITEAPVSQIPTAPPPTTSQTPQGEPTTPQPPEQTTTRQRDEAVKEIEETQKELEKVARDLEEKVRHESKVEKKEKVEKEEREPQKETHPEPNRKEKE